MTGDDSGSERTETGVPPDEPGRGLTDWKPLSLCAANRMLVGSDGLVERLPSEDDEDDAGRLLAVPTMESIEKPILGLLGGGDEVVTAGGEERMPADLVSSIMLNWWWLVADDLRPLNCIK